MENQIKKRTLFSLRSLPQVIELYVGLDRKKEGNPPQFFAYHLKYWLRNCAIPGKSDSGGSYPDGSLLLRRDADLINSSVRDIFGTFVFLKPGSSSKKARKLARTLTRASKICWRGKKADFHSARAVEKPEGYLPLHLCLLGLLNGSRHDIRPKEEIDRIAEYFVIYCQSDKITLKKLALGYHLTDKERDVNRGNMHSVDD